LVRKYPFVLLSLCAYLGGALVVTPAALAQVKASDALAADDSSKLGHLRNLATLSYGAFQNGDRVTAGVLARSLERSWDEGEAARLHSQGFEALMVLIDAAMDGFVKNVGNANADPKQIDTAYHNYLEKLKLDEPVTLDSGRMGVYRSLALLTYRAFLKGQRSDRTDEEGDRSGDWYEKWEADSCAQILETTWEIREADLVKMSPDLHKRINEAMEAFVKPIMGWRDGKVDPDKVDAAYSDYLDKLKQAN
jgi:hypothetical protein